MGLCEGREEAMRSEGANEKGFWSFGKTLSYFIRRFRRILDMSILTRFF
jgi:hypothetical protein